MRISASRIAAPQETKRCAGYGCASFIHPREKYCRRCQPLMSRQLRIYFIGVPQLGNVVKIGKTVNLESRLHALATGCPYPPEALATVKADCFVERSLHKHFAEFRIHCEWFRLVPEIQEAVDLARAGHLQRAINDAYRRIDRGDTVLVPGEQYVGTKIRKLREQPVGFPRAEELIARARAMVAA